MKKLLGFLIIAGLIFAGTSVFAYNTQFVLKSYSVSVEGGATVTGNFIGGNGYSNLNFFDGASGVLDSVDPGYVYLNRSNSIIPEPGEASEIAWNQTDPLVTSGTPAVNYEYVIKKPDEMLTGNGAISFFYELASGATIEDISIVIGAGTGGSVTATMVHEVDETITEAYTQTLAANQTAWDTLDNYWSVNLDLQGSGGAVWGNIQSENHGTTYLEFVDGDNTPTFNNYSSSGYDQVITGGMVNFNPEPSTILMFLFGIAGLCAKFKKKLVKK